MTPIANRDMILSAAEVLNPHMVGDRLFGDVACDLVAASGMPYQGVCIDTVRNRLLRRTRRDRGGPREPWSLRTLYRSGHADEHARPRH